MKRILAVFFCLIFMCSVVACGWEVPYSGDELSEAPKTDETSEKNETTESASQDAPADGQLPYTAISEQERLTWRDKIITVISDSGIYDEYAMLRQNGWEHNFYGMALMDLNFDNTPELITVYSGGSMGNVNLTAYDLESGEKLDGYYYDTPHYQDADNVYFCYYRHNDGGYILVNKGSLRFGLEGYILTSKLNDNLRFTTLFEEVVSQDCDSRYYCSGNEVDKAEFEAQKAQFESDYKELAETQLKIIYWSSIFGDGKGAVPKTKSEVISEMADRLVSSEQQFICFDRSEPTEDQTAKPTFSNYNLAYLDFLKDKKDGRYVSFSLVYIDNDDVPELYLSGIDEATGDMICSFKNGAVITQRLGRKGGGKYIPLSGVFINQNGHMGYYYDIVYRLNYNGFSMTLEGIYTESFEENGKGGSWEYVWEYIIDGSSVTRDEYNTAVNSAFDFSKAVELYENTVSYDSIIQQLQGGIPDGK